LVLVAQVTSAANACKALRQAGFDPVAYDNPTRGNHSSR